MLFRFSEMQMLWGVRKNGCSNPCFFHAVSPHWRVGGMMSGVGAGGGRSNPPSRELHVTRIILWKWGYFIHSIVTKALSRHEIGAKYLAINAAWRLVSGYCVNSLPPTLEKFTTRPWTFLIRGRNVLVTSITPHRLTSAVRLNILIDAQSIGIAYAIPALFTRPHSPPINKEIWTAKSRF